jgi:hypothetical protein
MNTPYAKVQSPYRALLVLIALVGAQEMWVWAAEETSAPEEVLERPGLPRLEGRLVGDGARGLGFVARGDKRGAPLPLEAGAMVRFQGPGPGAASIPPLYHVEIGATARISGMLRLVEDRAVTLSVPWQAAPVTLARPGVQAILQRTGEARVFADAFERLDLERWSKSGKVEPLSQKGSSGSRGGVRLPAGGSALEHRLGEPLVSGRLDLSFLDAGPVVAGQSWTLELTFRGPSGPAALQVLLGWAEESLAVESPSGPSLPVQRLARAPGWHRLALRFGPDQTEIGVDGKELAHGKGPVGPLESIRIATKSSGSTSAKAPPDLAGVLGEIQLVRFAEPPASLEIDPSQDEARLIVGDQLYGSIRRADAEHVTIEVDSRLVVVDWKEVAGLHLRRAAAAGSPVEGVLVRAEWRATRADPKQSQDVDHVEGALASITETAISLATPYAGTLSIPRDRLAGLRILGRGRLLILDPAAHHLGDNISTTPPLLNPPVPEGGILERSFELEAVDPRPASLLLDVVQVVGESAGSPYSNLVLKGELRTYIAVNGKRIDYINHYVFTANDAPERIRVPIPAGVLKPGKNTVRIEQTGIASDPNWLDDLGILQIALWFSTAGEPAQERSPTSTAKP